jgi:hypothetical protein
VVKRTYNLIESPFSFNLELVQTRPVWNAITMTQLEVPVNGRRLWAGNIPDPLVPPPLYPPTLPVPMGGPLIDDIDLAASTSKHVLGPNIELWEFQNNTGDVHPMHLHHAMFYVLGRWGLNAGVMGAKQPVDANEQAGWKDTVRVNPGQVTRLLVRFDNQGDTANNYTGHYVFHCHLLEHEDMGMMRPLEIFP